MMSTLLNSANISTAIITVISSLISTLVAGLIVAYVSFIFSKKLNSILAKTRQENDAKMEILRHQNTLDLEKLRIEQKTNFAVEENSYKITNEFYELASYIISSYKRNTAEDEVFDFEVLKNDHEGRELIAKFNMFFTKFDFAYEMHQQKKISDSAFNYMNSSMDHFMKEKYYQQAFEYFIQVDTYTEEMIGFIKSKYQ